MGWKILTLLSGLTFAVTAHAPLLDWAEVQAKLASHRELQTLCGPLSALRMAALHQIDFSAEKILTKHTVSPQGATIKQVNLILNEFGKVGHPVRCHQRDLTELRLPCILITHNDQHCLVLEEIDKENHWARIWEPSTMHTAKIPLTQLDKLWSRKAILVDSTAQTIRQFGDLMLVLITTVLVMFTMKASPLHQLLASLVQKIRKLGLQDAFHAR